MSDNWIKLGVEFDALSDALSDTAYRLLVCSWGHSNRHLLDMEIPASEVPLFARNVRGDIDTAIGELVDDGWWISALVAHRGRQVPGWNVAGKCARWQRTRDQVITDQAANRRRVANWREDRCLAGEHSRHCPSATCPEKKRGRGDRNSHVASA